MEGPIALYNPISVLLQSIKSKARTLGLNLLKGLFFIG